MKIFPAVDLKDGQVVRLLQGDYGQVTRYALSPVEAARGFADAGARYLHVVDLDGAKDGTLANFDVIRSVVEATDLYVEVGGGIRDEDRIRKYLDAGVGRVILGTAAVQNFPFLTEMVRKYGPQIAVGVDAKDGRVAVDGWLTVTELDGVAFCRQLRDVGVQQVIYTDIARDGALTGTNLDVYAVLREIDGLSVTASGGISYLSEIRELHAMGIDAAIVGKAIYTGMLDLGEVLAAAGEQSGEELC